MPITEKLNVVILPPKEVSQKTVGLSETVAKEYPVSFTLNEQDRIPHISLYQAAYPTKNISQVKTVLKDIATNSWRFHIELSNIYWQKEGWLDFQAEKVEDLLLLHKQVIERINQLREDSTKQTNSKNSRSYSLEEQENMKKYGYRYAMNLFRPHLTITRLTKGDEGSIETAAQKLEGNTFSFMADTIALCELGEHGTCTGILESWSLR